MTHVSRYACYFQSFNPFQHILALSRASPARPRRHCPMSHDLGAGSHFTLLSAHAGYRTAGFAWFNVGDVGDLMSHEDLQQQTSLTYFSYWWKMDLSWLQQLIELQVVKVEVNLQNYIYICPAGHSFNFSIQKTTSYVMYFIFQGQSVWSDENLGRFIKQD